VRHFAFSFLVLAFAPSFAHATPDVDAWRQDLHFLATEMPRRHPNLFYRMSEASWDSAVAAVDARLPAMDRNQTIVAFMELVALPHDGHTLISPGLDPHLGFHFYPIELYAYEDGVFIRRADPAHAALVGARVLRIGSASIDEALAAATRTVSTENEWWSRAWAPERLVIPELLNGLGIAPDPDHLRLEIERAGKRSVVTLGPAGAITPHGHDPLSGIDRTGWPTLGKEGVLPLWRRDPGKLFDVEYTASESLLYVRYRAVLDSYGGETNAEFWHRVFALADSLPVARFVLDIRENIGGNNFNNRQVVRALIQRPALDRKDRLFVVIGKRTFSAAMNLVLDLEHWTNATFVGEPTGNATVVFGDHEPLNLPRSGMQVQVSTLAWYPPDPKDHRDAVTPAIYTPVRSPDDLAARDPAVAAILAYGSRPDLVGQVRAAVERGDSVAAERVIKGAQADEKNRFRRLVNVANQVGYGFLNDGRLDWALAAFRLNARLYPRSPNVWDSLGEGLARAAKKDDAIAAYRQALALDPGLGSAQEGLARLSGK
jgi:hypothetical protein